MEDIFAMVVRSSIVGAVFIALILFIRWGTRKTTKFYVRILWLLLLAELLVPPVFKSPFQSMRGILEHAKVPASYEWMLKTTDGTADGKRDERQNTDALEHPEFRGEISVTAGGNLLENQKESEKTNNWRKLFALMSGTVFLSLIWLTGAVAMLFYYLEEFFRLYRRVRYAVRTKDGAWECDRIDTPFVLPGAKV